MVTIECPKKCPETVHMQTEYSSWENHRTARLLRLYARTRDEKKGFVPVGWYCPICGYSTLDNKTL